MCVCVCACCQGAEGRKGLRIGRVVVVVVERWGRRRETVFKTSVANNRAPGTTKSISDIVNKRGTIHTHTHTHLLYTAESMLPLLLLCTPTARRQYIYIYTYTYILFYANNIVRTHSVVVDGEVARLSGGSGGGGGSGGVFAPSPLPTPS